MTEASKAAAALQEAMTSKIMEALSAGEHAANDDKAAGLVEDAIVAALQDFDREHPLRITVTADDMSDEDTRLGFMRCTLRAWRPSLDAPEKWLRPGRYDECSGCSEDGCEHCSIAQANA